MKSYSFVANFCVYFVKELYIKTASNNSSKILFLKCFDVMALLHESERIRIRIAPPCTSHFSVTFHPLANNGTDDKYKGNSTY